MCFWGQFRFRREEGCTIRFAIQYKELLMYPQNDLLIRRPVKVFSNVSLPTYILLAALFPIINNRLWKSVP